MHCALPSDLGADGCGGRICAFADADDIVLYSQSRFGMQPQLLRVDNFFKAHEMSLNSKKCVSIANVVRGKARKMALVTEPIFIFGDHNNRSVGIKHYFKYLRSEVGHSGGLRHIIESHVAVVFAVGRRPLKP